jgi:TRAP-type C4-dicarboxylate transport system permease small subunit
LTLRTAQVAQVVLVFVMLIVVANVVSRIWWKPVPGTVELVEMGGAVLLALSVAFTAYKKGHIAVGVLVERFPPRLQALADLATSALALFFCSLLARETFSFAGRMMKQGYSTGLLRLPIAPSIYLVAFGFAMLALVLCKDLLQAAVKLFRGSEQL